MRKERKRERERVREGEMREGSKEEGDMGRKTTEGGIERERERLER